MKSSGQRTNATFIIRFMWERRGPGDGDRKWRVRLLHVESREQFHGLTFDEIRAVCERYGFTDETQTTPPAHNRVTEWMRRCLFAWRRNRPGRKSSDSRQ